MALTGREMRPCWPQKVAICTTSNGYAKRYGLIYVNRDDKDLKDLARIKKDSFYWYQKVSASNGRER